MTRTLWWAAPALALALWALLADASRLAAQTPTGDSARSASTTDNDATSQRTTSSATEQSQSSQPQSEQQPGQSQTQQTQPGQPQTSANQRASAAQPQSQNQGNPGQQGQQQGQAAGAQAQANVEQEVTRGVQFGQATEQGLAISNLDRTSFFYDSGVRSGDVLVSISGQPVRSRADFVRWAANRPGERVPVIVIRQGRPETLWVTYRQNNRQPGVQYEQSADWQQAADRPYLGVTFDPRAFNRATIASVNPGSPAEHAGLRQGDSIESLNGNRVSSPPDVIRVVASMQPGDRLEIEYWRPAENRTEAVLGNRPSGGPQTASYRENQTGGPPSATSQAPQPGQPPAPQYERSVRARDAQGRYIDRGRPNAERDGALLPRNRN